MFAPAHASNGRLTWMHRAYTGLLLPLLTSTPIGVALAWIRT